jgi:3-hydroxyacyl-CoA dehydrogenase
MNVIGLGGVGGRIAKQFEQYPQYNVVSVDHEQQTETTILVKKQTDPEAYRRGNYIVGFPRRLAAVFISLFVE